MVETPKALRLLAHTPGPSLLRSEHLSPEATTLPELLRGGPFTLVQWREPPKWAGKHAGPSCPSDALAPPAAQTGL